MTLFERVFIHVIIITERSGEIERNCFPTVSDMFEYWSKARSWSKWSFKTQNASLLISIVVVYCEFGHSAHHFGKKSARKLKSAFLSQKFDGFEKKYLLYINDSERSPHISQKKTHPHQIKKILISKIQNTIFYKDGLFKSRKFLATTIWHKKFRWKILYFSKNNNIWN